MNPFLRFIKTLLFVPVAALVSAAMLIEVGWLTVKTGYLSWQQLLARFAGKNSDGVSLAQQHVLSVREVMSLHNSRVSALSAWCFKKPNAKTA